jgi:hypothetical protein
MHINYRKNGKFYNACVVDQVDLVAVARTKKRKK